VPAGTTLLDAGRRAGLLLTAACGGVGVCGKCRVAVIGGELSSPEAEEQAFLKANGSVPGARLACKARVLSSTVIEVPSALTGSQQSIHFDAPETLPISDPLIRAFRLCIDPPTMGDARSDYARISDALAQEAGVEEWTMHPSVARQFGELCASQQLTVFCRSSEIIGIAGGEQKAVGLAVDLGCTKIAAYLRDLENGEQLAAAGVPNPQIPFGEDLISRLVYAVRAPEQAAELASRVRESIASLAVELCSAAGVHPCQIADVCVVGNTAMMHLFLQLPVARLLHAPFVAAIDCEVELMASELGWSFAPRSGVHVLPSIGGFVGADHVAMILAQDIDRTEKVTVGIDIGTNTEIVVRDPASGKLLTTSVPSGPVFEGGHISNGMRAAAGAIDKFFLLDGELSFHTIGDARPIGICGSGVLDLLASMLRMGAIDERGRILDTSDGDKPRALPSFLVVPAEQSGHGNEIVLTQHDVTQVQLAKAAIFAGISTLLSIAEIPAEGVAEVVVAGQFGSCLDLASAVAIGLLPTLPNARYVQVGNAAGRGAQMALVSIGERARARRIAKCATRVELKQYRIFDQFMARATRFPRVSAQVRNSPAEVIR
jgi:uncharacterized 2Fe-2S/4Fe-4S cluster protein (DUF4445 family)